MKKKGVAWGEFKEQIFPGARFLSRKYSVTFFLSVERG